MRPPTAIIALALVLAATASATTPPPQPVQTITAYAMGTATPTIDGRASDGEWPWAPQISITPAGIQALATFLPNPVVPTYVIFASNATDLYVLVDAPGDTTVSTCDECLLAFDTNTAAPYFSAEMYGGAAFSTATVLGGLAAMGYGTSQFDTTNNHRIYEFRIPLASLGAAPLQPIYFASPIDPTAPKKCLALASMPYDGDTGNDNAWPPGLDPSNRGTWGVIILADKTVAVPALSGLGTFVLIGLLAAAALVFLVRRGV